MTESLLTTKFYVPPVRQQRVSRPHLIERLDAIWRRPLTLVSAPAGFGKTTMVADWLHHVRAGAEDPTSSKDQHHYAWLSLDSQDNDPARFFRYLSGALSDARPISPDDDALSLQSQLTHLINDLAALPGHTILVLDDYHVITAPAIHDALAFLIEHLPPRAHLVILSRADPPFPLARLRTRGQVNEIRAVDLRFTTKEATQFLNDVMELSLAPDEIDALEARTEGWISGLQMAALSLRGRAADRVEAFIAAFSGSHRHVIDYLATEVLAQQRPAMRDFMCQTAILDRMTAPLCNAVTGRQDSAQILIQLEQDNLFVVPLDERREWYRYHRLFADFMRTHLEQQYPDRIQDLHCWAAEWYEQNGFPGQAIEHVLQAGDVQWAARLIEQQAQRMLMHGQINRLLGWLEALPDQARRAQAALSVHYASALLIAGHWQQAEQESRQIEWLLESPDTSGLDQSLIGQVYAVRAYLSIYRGNLHQTVEYARRASTYMGRDTPFLKNIVRWMQGFALLFSGDTGAASETLIENIASSQQAGNVLMTMLSVYVHGYLLTMRGRLREAEQVFERGLLLAQVDRRPPGTIDDERSLSSAGIVHQGLGDVLRERNDLPGAQYHIEKAIELCTIWGNAEPLVDAYIGLARVRRAQQEWASAHQALQHAAQFALTGQVSDLTAWQVDLHRARLWIAQGKLENAAACMALGQDPTQFADVPSSPVWAFLVSLGRATAARLYIARQAFDQASQVLQPTLEQVDCQAWKGICIELMILQALAYDGQQASGAALDLLERALSLAQPEGYMRILLDEGSAMSGLLSRLQRRGVPDGLQPYLDRLLVAFAAERPPASAPHPAPQPAALPEPLTPRERQVLALIVAGLTNPEIAEQLFVAHSTVKTHINHIYQKLDVSRRTQAIARARELDLL